MNLNKPQKIILGVFTVLPFILLPIMLWQVLHMILEIIKISDHGEPEPREILIAVFSFIVPIVAIGLGGLVLLIFYIVHVITNKKLEGAEQILWVLLFVFFGIIAFPIYWILRIWNNADKA
jgi:hypothetical protein